MLCIVIVVHWFFLITFLYNQTTFNLFGARSLDVPSLSTSETAKGIGTSWPRVGDSVRVLACFSRPCSCTGSIGWCGCCVVS
ncbi:hypothetical protein YC2023_079135 [Brassica napus]